MKKILALLFFGLALGTAAIAQPTINFSTESPCNGQNFCMDVTVDDFTDIKSMKFTIQFDPTVLQNASVTSIALPGLIPDLSNAANGFIGIVWEGSPCGTPAPGTDLPDGSLIFQLCFNAVGTYGQTAEVCVAGLPVPEVFREGTGCSNIGLLSTCGLVSLCVRPVELLISDATASEGDLVCIDFRVTGFDALRSMQFSINWNPAILNYENCIVGNVPNLTCGSSFGLPPSLPEGTATFSWAYPIPDQPGITLVDSFLFFQMCFRVVGNCEESTLIEISDGPTMIEVTNDIEDGFNITFLPDAGTFTANSCAPTGLQLVADCGPPVELNQTTCVQVLSGSNFNNISRFAYLMKWNPSILEYTGVQNLNPLIGNFTQANFNPAQAANGILGVDWAAAPLPNETLPLGTVMYEVCFEVVGLGGNSPFSFSTPANVRVGTGPNIGINPSNCEVQVIQPQGVVMGIGDAEALPGEEACVDVTVSNFEDILSYQFSMSWDTDHMTFSGINNIALPEATIDNFTVVAPAGLLFFQWDPGTAYTLDDETVIFQICFDMVSPPNVCDDLELVDLPLAAAAVSSTSNGENIGVIGSPGEVCTLFPEGYGIIIEEAEGDRQDTACVQFSVTSFDNITNTDFEINWDPAALAFVSVESAGTWPGFTVGGNVNTANSGVGSIEIDWQNLAGAAIGGANDTTVVFEVCYHLIGTPGECFDISISDTPSPIVETLNGEGSLLVTNGEMCINDRLIIESVVITPVSCAGSCDGTIVLTVSGGQGQIGSSWTQGGMMQFTPLRAENLCSGDTLYVRIYDTNTPNSLILEDTFLIPERANQPMADAGEDRLSGCNPPGLLVTGMGSIGSEFNHYWKTVSGGPVGEYIAPTMNQATFLPGPGTYVFSVVDTSGCTARDTMVVMPSEVPMAIIANDPLSINCVDEIIILDGSASTNDGIATYLWTSPNGGVITPGEENLSTSSATAPGTYILRVRYPVTGCEARDTVVIEDGRIYPNASGGPFPLELDCIGTPVPLDGTPSDNQGLNVSYQWFDTDGTPLAPGIIATVTELGTYTLIVTNDDTGCRDTAMLQVVPSQDYPQISITGDTTLTCLRDSAIFTAVISPDTVLYDFTWTAISGGPLEAGTETTLSPEARFEGLYQISVTNPNNNCTSLDTFEVLNDMEPPIANAGEDDMLTCDEPTHTLDPSGSDMGPDIVLTWTDETGTEITNLEVSAAGTYYLEVLNTTTGCSAIDSIIITSNGQAPPMVTIATPTNITCTTTFTTLTGTATPAGMYTYEWTALPGGGNIIGPTDALVTQVNQGGIYRLLVTDANGCSGSADVTVLKDTIPPTANAGEPQVILCNPNTVSLGGDGTSVGVEFTYQWTAISGGQTPSPNNVFPATATVAGTYKLTVFDSSNGCMAMDTVVVTANQTDPQLPSIIPDVITCIAESVVLDASATTPSANITVTWTGTNGAPTPADQLVTMANVAGDYTLTVVNNANGCEASATYTVSENTMPPTVNIDTPPAFSCASPSVTLNASASGLLSTFSSVVWTTMDGGTITPPTGALIVQVNAPGIYELTLTRLDNGCEATNFVTVLPASDTPVADAGDDFTIGCGEMTVLDGSGSSTGANFVYQWTNISGGNAPTPSNTQNPNIEATGTFQLVVTNTNNNCMDTDTVVVTLNNSLDMANAGTDQSLCADGATLTGNLPAGATGVWTSSTGATITSPNEAMTEVSNLINGQNIFTWTLSAPGCENYSSDMVTITSSGQPTANNDVLTIGADTRTGTLNVLANDGLTGITNYEVTLIGGPTFGMVDSFVNGVLTFTVGVGASGMTDFAYQICNLDCSGQCDTARIVINVEDDGKEPELPNTITPNGDGLNETLVFDILLSNPAEDFPNNELIVFNRWGDIVYQSKPYTNNWGGTNNDGKELPHGTYYYILRLNIGNRDIIRGDVTIVK